MQAKDIMSKKVITAQQDATVQEIARLLRENRISAVPVVDRTGKLLGIVSEDDLIRRPELGTERHPAWWLSLLANPKETTLNYIKSHAGRARDVMTEEVITTTEDASLADIADMLEKHRIKRVPVLRDGEIVGVVSRADLLRGLVARESVPASVPASVPSDCDLRTAIEKELEEAAVDHQFISVMVVGGVAHLWGMVESDTQKKAAQIAVESVAGIKRLDNKISTMPSSLRAAMWAE